MINRSLSRVYNRLALSVQSIGAMIRVKAGRPLITPISRLVSLLGGRTNHSVVRVIISYLSNVNRLYKHGGLRFVVVTLKAASTMLQQSVAGQRLSDLTPLGVRLSRSRGTGIPKLIPALHRARIRKGEIWVIRFWMTLFGLYRVIPVDGILKLKTIIDTSTMEPQLLSVFYGFLTKRFLPALRALYPEARLLEALTDSPLDFLKSLRATPFLISKSTPIARLADKDMRQDENLTNAFLSTSPTAILLGAYLWKNDQMYPFLTNWCQMTGNTWVLNRIELWTKGFDPKQHLVNVDLGKASMGYLGMKLESAGKVRVFALMDCWTQWLLKPFHDCLFDLLRQIPQDGTFDQLKPIERLLAKASLKGVPMYSFDLSAATDRLPLRLQKTLLSPFLTSWGAELWGHLVSSRPFTVPLLPKGVTADVELSTVYYEAGQPMGALSSWGMLAFTHHAIVQWAAFLADKTSDTNMWFEDYAVLGDDVVIVNEDVAQAYSAIMHHLGVAIGHHKSVISIKGRALEFAKRFFALAQNASPAPFLEFFTSLKNISAYVELARKYSLTLGQFLTGLGYGYRAKATCTGRLFNLPNRLRNYILAYYSPSGVKPLTPLEYLSMKSVGVFHEVTATKYVQILDSFTKASVMELLVVLDRLAPLKDECMRYSTVYRDREHYGTGLRNESRIWDLPGLSDHGMQLWKERFQVFDSIRENVYREAFIDTAIAMRDLRTKLEEIASTPSPDAFDSLWTQIDDLRSLVGSLPLPTNLTNRVKVRDDLKTVAMIVKRWYAYSSHVRSTKAS